MNQFHNPETRVAVTLIRTAFDSIFPDRPDLWEQFEDRLHTAWFDGFTQDLHSAKQEATPSYVTEEIPEPVQYKESTPTVNLFFPNIVNMLVEKNVRLHLNGCKTHISQAGIMSLVSPIFGGGYYGRFSTRGWFEPNKTCKLEFIDQLRDIEDNGVEAAKRIGMLTGNCCVCGRTLTAEGSVEAGIGPICAGKAF